MNKQDRHNYLVYLIEHLEHSDDNTALDNFFVVAKDILKVRHTLSRVLDYPITLDQYEELITYAENLLGVNRFGSSDDLHYEHLLGRTNDATSVESAQSIDEKLNNMMAYNDKIITDALVDQALVDMDLVNHVLENYTPDQLTIDIIKDIAAKGGVVDGVKINKQTADYIAAKIKDVQDDGLFAFVAKQDIKKGDFVLIDKDDNQSITPAADMEVSPVTLQDLFDEFEKNNPQDYAVAMDDNGNKRIQKISDEVMEHFKEAYAALANIDEHHHSGAVYNLDEVKDILDRAPDNYKKIWSFEPFQQFFVGDITGMKDFPFIYKNQDPSYDDYVRNTPVVGPFNSMKELEDYFDLMVHEETGMYDSDYIKRLRGLVVMIKHYESKSDAHVYATIIDKLWENLKSFLLGNI
jgi:hypothetical protein